MSSFCLFTVPITIRLSSSFLKLPYRILNIHHKKELLRGLWARPGSLTSFIGEARFRGRQLREVFAGLGGGPARLVRACVRGVTEYLASASLCEGFVPSLQKYSPIHTLNPVTSPSQISKSHSPNAVAR